MEKISVPFASDVVLGLTEEKASSCGEVTANEKKRLKFADPEEEKGGICRREERCFS